MAEAKWALLSVYHKEGIVEFAKELVALGWQILASGGTARALLEGGVAVRDVASLVGGGPILGHRVVTLSREVHAGLLAQDTPEDRAELEKLNVPYIDLVCVDLYPLEEEIRREGSTRESVIEKTDIGGPTMLRSAAKGGRIVISIPKDREMVLWLLKKGEMDEGFRKVLAAKAEYVIAKYCLASARYHSEGRCDGLLGTETKTCAYGENGWQKPASLFTNSTADADPLAVSKYQLLYGSEPSYNLYCFLHRMDQTIGHIAAAFEVNRRKMPMIAIGAKHGNPCGAAVGNDPNVVIGKMLMGDSLALFGGQVMTNFTVTEQLAGAILTHAMPADKRRILDTIIAPSFDEGVAEMFKRRVDKCRVFANPALWQLGKATLDTTPMFRPLRGGEFLRQPNYTFVLDLEASYLKRSKPLTPEQEEDLLLAWAVGSTSNSNTVTLVKNKQLIGNGVGQMDRWAVAELSVQKARRAEHDIAGAVGYSDSFFPFDDGPKALIDAGVRAILSSSGSINDQAVTDLCKERDVPLVMGPDGEIRGFCWH